MQTLTALALLLAVNYVLCEQVLYDRKHHKAIILRPGTGCYEYHMNHQESQDSFDDALRPALETKMIDRLNCSTDIHEVGHHSIDHLTTEIRTACASVPVYGFDQTGAGCTTPTSLPIISGSPISNPMP